MRAVMLAAFEGGSGRQVEGTHQPVRVAQLWQKGRAVLFVFRVVRLRVGACVKSVLARSTFASACRPVAERPAVAGVTVSCLRRVQGQKVCLVFARPLVVWKALLGSVAHASAKCFTEFLHIRTG